jgi:hypothetical protein
MREYSGPLRPGELSADPVQNRRLIYKKLREEGDYDLCYCPFFATLRDKCECKQCPICDRKGRNFLAFDPRKTLKSCRKCHELLHKGEHRIQLAVKKRKYEG